MAQDNMVIILEALRQVRSDGNAFLNALENVKNHEHFCSKDLIRLWDEDGRVKEISEELRDLFDKISKLVN